MDTKDKYYDIDDSSTEEIVNDGEDHEPDLHLEGRSDRPLNLNSTAERLHDRREPDFFESLGSHVDEVLRQDEIDELMYDSFLDGLSSSDSLTE